MNYFLVSLISGVLILAGIFGSLLPILPGLPVAFLGILIFAIYTKFSLISGLALAVFAILTVLTIIVDTVSAPLFARGHKASNFGTAGALIGAILGVFVLGPLGILLGPFIGAFIGELANASDAHHAWRVAFGALWGTIAGTAFKLIVGLSMFVYFLIRVF